MVNHCKKDDKSDIFCLTVNFEQNTTAPHLLFRSIADMIMEFQVVDQSLTRCMDSAIEPYFVLDEVEKGSIKVWLRQVLQNIPDEAIADMDPKKVIGSFLVKAKHRVIEKMDDPDYLIDPSKVQVLACELKKMAEDTDLLISESFAKVDAPKLLESMNRISKIAKQLPCGSKFTYSSDDTTLDIKTNFEIPQEYIEQLAEKEHIENKSTMIIKVKQPDYLGSAQWVFKYDGKNIKCNFNDEEWLLEFHSRNVDIRPGDSLRVEMDVRVGYDDNHEVVSQNYTIVKVLEIIALKPYEQTSLMLPLC